MFAFFLHVKFKIKAALTPIISLTSIICFVIIFSLFKLLFVGVVLAYIITICLFIYIKIKNRKELLQHSKNFFNTGVILFITASMLMLVFLAIKEPLYSQWDEFSFWGTSQKLLSINDQLYTFYDSSLIGNTTPPTLGVLNYFFCAFNTNFIEWVSFFAYDVMLFAVCASFTVVFKKDKWYGSIAMFLLGFLLPFFFTVYTNSLSLIPNYINAYADIPLGMMFASCMAVHFLGSKNNNKNIACLMPLIMFLTLIKDMGFALSCLVAFIVFFNIIAKKQEYKFLFFKGVVAKFIATATIALTAFAAFMGWSIHMGAVMQVNRFNLGGEQNMGMVTMVLTGISELFSLQKSDKFVAIFDSMIAAFFDVRVSMIGTGIIIVALICAIFLFAFISCVKSEKLRVALLFFASLVGFVCYYIFHIFLYVYIFKDNGYYLPSYERYIYPYYFGWLMLGLIVALTGQVQNKLLENAKTVLLNVFVIAIFMLNTVYTSSGNMFLNINESHFSIRNTVKDKIEFLGDAVEKDDVIYCLSGIGDHGLRWLIYSLEYAENKIVLEVPGLYEYWPENYDGTEEEAQENARQYIIEDFKQKGVTHLLLDYSNEFSEVYLAQDFESPTIVYGITGIAYYEVEYIGDDDIDLHLIKGGQITND